MDLVQTRNSQNVRLQTIPMLNFKRCDKRPPVQFTPNPKFGSVFAPHALRINFTEADLGRTLNAEIIPFEREMFSPATIALHYGQSVFEGMKAYRLADGSVAAFRAELHAARFMRSCARMAMPLLGEENFLTCLNEYLKFEQESVPSIPEHSLYLRPIQFGRDEIVKVGRSKLYSFYILATIAGPYFHSGKKPARVLVNREFVRAFPGGTGEIKTAANYALSLWPQTYAEQFQCDQVLYLDALNHDSINELGGMNFFMVKDGALHTPSLSGTILRGVTRESILQIAPSLGIPVHESDISFSQMMGDMASGKVTEAFACGTAAVIHSIGDIVYQPNSQTKPEVLKLQESTPVADKLYKQLCAIQRAEIPAPGPWHFRLS
ncbi:MAG: branched-chain amino acid aminotransferase [Oligoflexia bacterium]|nr:branched-chain amino acid aminotransferase [Oligoflexia bacterium]